MPDPIWFQPWNQAGPTGFVAVMGALPVLQVKRRKIRTIDVIIIMILTAGPVRPDLLNTHQTGLDRSVRPET